MMWCGIVTDFNYGDGNEIVSVFTSENRELVVDKTMKSIRDRFSASNPQYPLSTYVSKYDEMVNGCTSFAYYNGMIEIHQSTHV